MSTAKKRNICPGFNVQKFIIKYYHSEQQCCHVTKNPEKPVIGQYKLKSLENEKLKKYWSLE